MFGVGISLPKQLMSLKPISSASMIMMFGLLLVLMIVLEEEKAESGQGVPYYFMEAESGVHSVMEAPKII